MTYTYEKKSRERSKKTESLIPLISPRSPPPLPLPIHLTASHSLPLIPPRSSGGCWIHRIPHPPIPLRSHLYLSSCASSPSAMANSGGVQRIPPSRSTARGPHRNAAPSHATRSGAHGHLPLARVSGVGSGAGGQVVLL
uniref:Uncharacterized protein n=1 Tax=Triticum urartu TaxID=4572 RepID=A0A8R7R8P3_TRIUA